MTPRAQPGPQAGRTLGQALRFGLVGLAATGVHVAALTAGVELLGLAPVPANGAAFLIAVGVSWFGQSLWVFAARQRGLAQIWRFAVSVLAGLGLNLAIMRGAVGLLGLHYLIGFAAALVIVPAVNFLINKFWVFAEARDGTERG